MNSTSEPQSNKPYEGPCAVVLAAGKGTRMKSELPKVLCPVVDRAMIHFVLDALENAGIHRQIVVVGYKADSVKEELASRSNPSLEFVLQEEQLGTGHAVQCCREQLSNQRGPTIVVAGDSPLIQPQSLSTLLEHFGKNKARAAVRNAGKRRPHRARPNRKGCQRPVYRYR